MLKKVLLVEDEVLLAENLKNYLEKLPCEVCTAANGITGTRLARAIAPEVIVLDYRLPDMNGFQVLDALGAYWSGRCILITGHPSSEVLESARQRSITHIMFKPFPLEELRQLVGMLLEAPPTEQDGLPGLIADRRQKSTDRFPLKMYDGSWVIANRRSSEQTGAHQFTDEDAADESGDAH